MSDRLAVLLQYLLPKQALTVRRQARGPARRCAHDRRDPLVREALRRQHGGGRKSRRGGLSELQRVLHPGLKAGARRPLAEADFLCPVDGAISQFGAIERDQIYQAKGHSYSTTALLGGEATLAAGFENGCFATLYLSPRDYHRIHMPCAGRLSRMIYVPGELFSVEPTTARGVPGLFARNERVVCVFESARGPFVMVLVGATIVGSMATAWHGAWSIRRGPADRRNALRRAAHRACAWRGDGAFSAGLDGGDAVSAAHARVQPGLGAGRCGPHGRGHGWREALRSARLQSEYLQRTQQHHHADHGADDDVRPLRAGPQHQRAGNDHARLASTSLAEKM